MADALKADSLDRLETRRRAVIDAAIGLYLLNGFEATTVDLIADRAGVSRRSIFRYFTTKEDIVLAWTMATGPALLAVLDAGMCRIDPVGAAIDAVLRHLDAHRGLESLSLDVSRLIEATPSLMARSHEKYLVWEGMLAAGIVERGGGGIAAAMAAAIAIGGLRTAVREWTAGEGRDAVAALARTAFAALARPDEGKEP